MNKYFDKFVDLERVIANEVEDLEEVVVFSYKKGIYVMDNDYSFKKICERDFSTTELHFHDWQLYDLSSSIYKTLSNEVVLELELEYESAKRSNVKMSNPIRSMCFFENDLYYVRKNRVINNTTGKSIAYRNECIYNIYELDGVLYDFSDNKKSYKTLSKMVVEDKEFHNKRINQKNKKVNELFDDKKVANYLKSFDIDVKVTSYGINSLIAKCLVPRDYLVEKGILRQKL